MTPFCMGAAGRVCSSQARVVHRPEAGKALSGFTFKVVHGPGRTIPGGCSC